MPSDGILEKVVSMHESQGGSDKLIKTMQFFCGTVASFFEAKYGPTDSRAIGFGQIAAKCSEARFVFRYHAGGNGAVVQLENLKNESWLGNWHDVRLKLLHKLEGLSLLQYHIWEGLSFAGTIAPEMIGKRLLWLGGASKLGVQSCYGASLWCMFNMISSRIKLTELRKMEKELHGKGWTGARLADAQRMIDRTRTALKMSLIRVLFMGLPIVHFSLSPNSMFAIQPNWFMQVIQLVEGFMDYYMAWTGLSGSRPTLPLDEGDTKPKSA